MQLLGRVCSFLAFAVLWGCSSSSSSADISVSFYNSADGSNWDLVNMGFAILASLSAYAGYGIYSSNVNFTLDTLVAGYLYFYLT